MDARVAEIEASCAFRARTEERLEEVELAGLKYKMKALRHRVAVAACIRNGLDFVLKDWR
eukprot:4913281-Pleurochrysis_carterae.AAC.1